MNNLQIFNNEEFGEIRIVTVDGEPMFCLIDVCKALEIKNVTDVAKRLDEDERTRLNLGRQGETNFVTESGLYTVILRSDKPNAKKFRKWITAEVLPSIRKTGSYNRPMSLQEQLQIIAQGTLELTGRVDHLQNDFEDFKNDMPILGVEEGKITLAVKKKGIEVLGGKTSNAYRNRSLRKRIYVDIHRQIKREFEVTTYKAIKRNQTDIALEIVKSYTPPYILAEEIKNENAQQRLVTM